MATLASRLRWRVYPMLGKFRPDLGVDREPYSRFESPELRGVGPKVAKTRYFNQFRDVAGFMTVKERQTLYAFARHLPGPFLEIGSWVGLSTCHIASGIRDSGVPKRFVSIDLCPTAENFRPLPDGRYGFFYPATSETAMGTCTEQDYREDLAPVLNAPGGVSGALARNLTRFGLNGLVERHVGDFEDVAPDLPYKLIFVDAMHDANEIQRNAPRLLRFLHPGAVVVIHDLVCDPGNEPLLRRLLPLGHAFSVDGLLVGEVV